MTAAGPLPRPLLAAVAALAGLMAGGAAARSPGLALAAGAALIVIAVAATAPVATLTALLLFTWVVPYDLQNRFGGGPGLIAVDLLLLSALAFAGPRLFSRAFDRRTVVFLGGLALFLGLAALQVVRSVRLGAEAGLVGFEFRQVLGLATAFVAIPLLADPERRPALLRALVAAGLVLGVVGLAQWVLQVPANSSEDFGITTGVQLTTSGTGKLLGGRYVFPVAVVLSFAALSSPVRRPAAANAALLAVLLLNGLCLLLTFERAFWLAAVFGMLLVVIHAGHIQRARAIVRGGIGVVLIFAAMTVIAPSDVAALGQRLVSVGQYRTDTSVTYRLLESQFVLDEISAGPWLGQGLGASIYWGRPLEFVPPSEKTYSHNAYLRLAWKLGIPMTVLCLLLVAMAYLPPARRAGPPADADGMALRSGAQAGLTVLLIMGVTGPMFNELSSTATIGLLLGLVLVPAATTTAAGFIRR